MGIIDLIARTWYWFAFAVVLVVVAVAVWWVVRGKGRLP